MQNLFSFVGLTSFEIKEIVKPYFQQAKNEIKINWNFINKCWQKPYREAQYIGVYYLIKFYKKLQKDNLDKISTLIVKKSWWDTIDLLSTNVVGKIVKLDRINLEKKIIRLVYQ